MRNAPCKSGARFWGIQKQFLVRVSWMKFVLFEFRFSFLSRVPPILGSMPSNVLMFGYHQVYITHVKKAYLQGTVLLHFKHLKSLHSGKRIFCLLVQGILHLLAMLAVYPKFPGPQLRGDFSISPDRQITPQNC